MKNVSVTYLVLILLLSSVYGYAIQTKQIRFQNLNHNDGLADNFCETILQDSYGFIWIGTNDGLCKYNGSSFTTYRYNQFDTNTIGGNYVISIFEDSQKQLWIGTNSGGLSKYNRVTNNFSRIEFDAPDSIWSQRNRVNQILEIGDNIYIASMYGLGKMNKYTKATFWYLPQGVPLSADAGQVSAIAKDAHNNIWVAISNDGLFCFDTKSDTFVKHYMHSATNKNSLGANAILDIYESNGMLWLGTRNAGVSVFDSKTETFTNYTHVGNKSNEIKTFFRDSENTLWIGTINGGLYQWNEANKVFVKIEPFLSDQFYDSEISITHIIEDKDGNKWFTSHHGGIYTINKANNIFNHQKLNTTGSPVSKSNFASCFYELNDTCIWIGTDGNGLYSYNPQTGKSAKVTIRGGEEIASILDIEKSAYANKIWIATWAQGLFLLNTKTYKIEQHFAFNSQQHIPINNIKSLHFYNDTLWIGSHGNGVFFIAGTSQHVSTGDNTPQYHYLNYPKLCNVVFVDSKNRKWIGTFEGLYILVNNVLHHFYKSAKSDFSLNGFIISDVFEDNQKNIWVATENGLNLYNEDSKRFVPIGNEYNIPSKIHAIQQSNDSLLWISSNSGITLFNYKANKTIQYTEPDGLQGNLFIDRASLKLRNGMLLFGGQNGFNMFDSHTITAQITNLDVYISDIQISNNTQVVVLDTLATTAIKYRFLETDYSLSSFTIEFNALNISSPHRTTYAYRLVGVDSAWIFTQQQNKVIYTHLEPGTYEFQVKASTSIDALANNHHYTTISIVISPPWWKTMWFRLCIILLIVVVTLLIIYIRTKQVQQKNRDLEHKIIQRTKALENSHAEMVKHKNALEQQTKQLADKNNELVKLNTTKDRFFSILAHDLKNPIQIILGFSELLVVKKDTMTEKNRDKFSYLTFEAAKQVTDLLVNILDWSRTQTNNIVFHPKLHNIQKVIESNLKMVEIIAKNKHIELQLSCSVHQNVYFDCNMIETVLRNLITNAIKYTPEYGNIHILVNETQNSVEISVVDNGIGMNQEKINNLFVLRINQSTMGTAQETGTGLGLIICKEFIERHRGTLRVDSTEGKGTTVTFSIPK